MILSVVTVTLFLTLAVVAGKSDPFSEFIVNTFVQITNLLWNILVLKQNVQMKLGYCCVQVKMDYYHYILNGYAITMRRV